MRQMVWAVAISLLGATGAQAQDTEIRGTIERQLEAFKRDDFALAFTFASPELQGMFRTPDIFGQMVTQGYPMVWRPAAVAYLELREQDGTWLQKVQITDGAGRFHYLEYSMIQMPEGWRISGVQILDAPGAAV
jgi:hypothetical protein